jgi:hypothetical protein
MIFQTQNTKLDKRVFPNLGNLKQIFYLSERVKKVKLVILLAG